MTSSVNPPSKAQNNKTSTVNLDELWDDKSDELQTLPHDEVIDNEPINVASDMQFSNQYIPTPPKDELFIETEVNGPKISGSSVDTHTSETTFNQLSKNKKREKSSVSEPSEAEIGSHDESGFAKKIVRTSSWRAFYIHFGVVALFVLVAQFPALPLLLFSEQDLNAIPENIANNLSTIIMIVCYALSLVVIILVFKQKQTGSLHIYADYVVYKKSMFEKGITVHFHDIRTIDIYSGFATLYSDIGDFHLISPKQHITIKNLYQPFLLKDKINLRKNQLNSK